jgi:hypothetical protein
VASIARRGWQRVKLSFADEVAARSVERDAELFRQMSDVFRELARLSVDIGAVWRSVEELRATLAPLVNAATVEVDAEQESTELLGRLLQSTRARLDVLEEATKTST